MCLVTGDGFGRHVLQEFRVVVTNPDLRIGGLKHDDLHVPVTLQPHGEAVQVSQHLLALYIHRSEIEGHGGDCIFDFHVKGLEVFVFHQASPYLCRALGKAGSFPVELRSVVRSGTCPGAWDADILSFDWLINAAQCVSEFGNSI